MCGFKRKKFNVTSRNVSVSVIFSHIWDTNNTRIKIHFYNELYHCGLWFSGCVNNEDIPVAIIELKQDDEDDTSTNFKDDHSTP